MLYILHRRNTVEELLAAKPEYGIEMDIRSFGSRLVVTHDPFVNAVDFKEWLDAYKHKTLLLNIKEEGIEEAVLALVEQKGITEYFLLGLSFPVLVKMCQQGFRKIALRFSEYESMETVMNFAGKLDWVWVDCFDQMHLTKTSCERLSKHFKICLASPELEGHSTDLIREYKKKIAGMDIAAICTKSPDLWEKAR